MNTRFYSSDSNTLQTASRPLLLYLSWLCRKSFTFIAAFFINSLADSDQIAGTVNTYSTCKTSTLGSFLKMVFYRLDCERKQVYCRYGHKISFIRNFKYFANFETKQNMLIVEKMRRCQKYYQIVPFPDKASFKSYGICYAPYDFFFCNVSRIIFFRFITEGIEFLFLYNNTTVGAFHVWLTVVFAFQMLRLI